MLDFSDDPNTKRNVVIMASAQLSPPEQQISDFLSDILNILRAKFTHWFLPQTDIIKLRLLDNNLLSMIKPMQIFLIADFAYNFK